MKRSLLIILGIVIVLILIGIWVFVLMTGTPSNSDRFADFDLGNQDTLPITQPEPTDTEPTVNVFATDPLRQLTTKTVAGYAEVITDASSTTQVHFVESGTGHIFSIDLETGEEERISATTIPLTRDAALTPDGRYVLMQSGEGLGAEFVFGTLATSSDELSNFAFPEIITSFTATADNKILYATPAGNNTDVKQYDPITNETSTLFQIPFRQLVIDWHETVSGPHYVYPKANSRLEGFVYSYTEGVMSRLPISGYGLSAVGSSEAVVYSQVVNTGDYISNTLTTTDDMEVTLPLTVIPEKCDFSPTDPTIAICGGSLAEYSDAMPDVWYRGEIVPADGLWQIDINTNAATLIEDIFSSRQQTIDVVNTRHTGTTTHYYFQNKIDNTLWMYDFNL